MLIRIKFTRLTAPLVVGAFALLFSVFCGLTGSGADDAASDGDDNRSGGGSTGSSAGEPVSEAPVLHLSAEDLEGDLIEIVQWGGRGGGGGSCPADEDTLFSQPEWDTLINLMETQITSPYYPRFCACGLGNTPAEMVHITPDGERSDISEDARGVGCVAGDTEQAGTVPRPGRNRIEVLQDGEVTLSHNYTIRYERVNGGWGENWLAYFVGFRPGENVRVVYYVSDNDDGKPIPESVRESEFFWFEDAYVFQKASDLTTQADDYGMVVVDSDAGDHFGAIVGVSGSAGEFFLCQVDNAPGCGPVVSDALTTEDGITEADALFGRSPGTLDELYGIAAESGASGSQPTASLPPDRVIETYWAAISDGDYEAAWARLSPAFKQRWHSNDINDYRRGYVDDLMICETPSAGVRLVSDNGSSAVVDATVTYHRGASCEIVVPVDFRFTLVYDGAAGWLLDEAKVR